MHQSITPRELYVVEQLGWPQTGWPTKGVRGLPNILTENSLLLNLVCHLCKIVLVSTMAIHQLWKLLGIFVKGRDGGVNENGKGKWTVEMSLRIRG